MRAAGAHSGPGPVRRPALRLVAAAGSGGGVAATGIATARLGPGGDQRELPAGWDWDGSRLVVHSDQCGIRPLFYRLGPGEVAVGTSPLNVLPVDAPAEIDWDALAVFLRLGFLVGEDTCFREVRAMPPAGRLEWVAAGAGLRSGHAPPPALRLDRAAAVDAFVDVFRAAVRRRLPGEEYALPLSGGRDSRHLLFELCRQGAPPRLCVSGRKYPPDSGADARIGQLLAAATGVPSVRVGAAPDPFATQLATTWAQGLVSLEGGWITPVVDVLRRVGRVTYDGLGGDALTYGPAAVHPAAVLAAAFEDGRPDVVAGRLVAASRTDAFLDRLLAGPLAHALGRDRAVTRLAAELARHRSAAFPLASFHFWNRTRRAMAAAPCTLFGDLDVRFPYLDRDVVELLTGLPPAVLVDGGFHAEAIHRAYPRYAAIPYAGPPRRRPVVRLGAHRLHFLLALLAHAWWVEPRWRHAAGGVLGRLLAAGLGPHPGRAVSRLTPAALFLLQLDDAVHAASSSPGPGSVPPGPAGVRPPSAAPNGGRR